VRALRVGAQPLLEALGEVGLGPVRVHERVAAGQADHVGEHEMAAHVLAGGDDADPPAQVAGQERDGGQQTDTGRRKRGEAVGGREPARRRPAATGHRRVTDEHRQRGAAHRDRVQVPGPHGEQQSGDAECTEHLRENKHQRVEHRPRTAEQADAGHHHDQRDQPVDAEEVGRRRHDPGRGQGDGHGGGLSARPGESSVRVGGGNEKPGHRSGSYRGTPRHTRVPDAGRLVL
jgi:hypothetical protein